MERNDILNLEEQFKHVKNTENQDDLLELMTEIKRNHFPNVLEKSAMYREKYQDDPNLTRLLLLVEVVSHAQIGEYRKSTSIMKTLYEEADEVSGSELVTYGELAFMSNYKLSRRILSDAVKRMEAETEVDRIKLARGYLVLGESEEHLEKFTRAIKYYKEGLTYFQEDDIRDQYMMLYLHFKIGMLYSTKDETNQAIFYLEKTVELADDQVELKINSLVSLAKIYGKKEDNETAFSYLQQVLPLIEESRLAESLTHAEALIEMAFYYFDQSKLSEAIPYYKKAVEMYRKQSDRSVRKLGMVYMQYAYCLEHKETPETRQASKHYELAIEQLEKTGDRELLENAYADVIAFFENTDQPKKKRQFEERYVKMINRT